MLRPAGKWLSNVQGMGVMASGTEVILEQGTHPIRPRTSQVRGGLRGHSSIFTVMAFHHFISAPAPPPSPKGNVSEHREQEGGGFG